MPPNSDCEDADAPKPRPNDMVRGEGGEREKEEIASVEPANDMHENTIRVVKCAKARWLE